MIDDLACRDNPFPTGIPLAKKALFVLLSMKSIPQLPII